MLVLCCIMREEVPPPSKHWWQPCCFSRKGDGPSSLLIGREVEWHLYCGGAKHTIVGQHNAGALHSLCCSVTLVDGGGSMGRLLSQGRTEGSYVRKFSFKFRPTSPAVKQLIICTCVLIASNGNTADYFKHLPSFLIGFIKMSVFIIIWLTWMLNSEINAL